MSPKATPDAEGGGYLAPGYRFSADRSPRAAGGKSWAYQALTWAGWPRLEGGPGI